MRMQLCSHRQWCYSEDVTHTKIRPREVLHTVSCTSQKHGDNRPYSTVRTFKRTIQHVQKCKTVHKHRNIQSRSQGSIPRHSSQNCGQPPPPKVFRHWLIAIFTGQSEQVLICPPVLALLGWQYLPCHHTLIEDIASLLNVLAALSEGACGPPLRSCSFGLSPFSVCS